MESTRADTLIETLRMQADGSIPLWVHHAARLNRSAAALGFVHVSEDQLADLLHHIQGVKPPHADPDGDRRVRVLYARDGTLTVTVGLLAPIASPVCLAFATDILGPATRLDADEKLLQHKTTTRPWYDLAGEWLSAHPDIFDLVFFNTHDALCEGSRTNLYVQFDDEWLTPPVVSGCLPGTQRAELLASGRVRIAALTRDDVARAQAWRVSNALRGWRDATFVEHHA